MVRHCINFECETSTLFGVLDEPDPQADPKRAKRAVLVVVGGPQYRVGSHRQFLLLARALASAGHYVMRFDYRGMGDSEGAVRNFEHVQADIGCAVNTLMAHSDRIDEVVIWGLCDAASAALFYAPSDRRIAGLVLANPWVRTQAGEARAFLKHYYLDRLKSRDFWNRLASGKFDARAAARSLAQNLIRAGSGLAGLSAKRRDEPRGASPTRGPATTVDDATVTDTVNGSGASGPAETSIAESSGPDLPTRMLRAFEAFSGPALIVLSGSDLTAAEFEDTVRSSRAWRKLLANARVTTRRLEDANHTFSSARWKTEVEACTTEWLGQW